MMPSEASELCDEIVEAIDDLPEETIEKAKGYFESVRGKAVSMQESIEDRGTVTQPMANALRNMRSGVAKWEHDD